MTYIAAAGVSMLFMRSTPIASARSASGDARLGRRRLGV
jgi:hypothetical protein